MRTILFYVNRQNGRMLNILITHQLAIDFFGCVMMALYCIVEVAAPRFSGTLGVSVAKELPWVGFITSAFNLCVKTL